MIALHTRSNYSLMWGTASIQALCVRAKELGYERLALTDTDNLYGLWPFVNACKSQGLTPIIGAEITDPQKQWRAVCLVKDNLGYSNLCRLITRRKTDKRFSLQQCVPGFAKGLVVLVKEPELLTCWHDQGVEVAAHLPRSPLSREHPLCVAAAKQGITLVATPGNFFLMPQERPYHAMLRAIAKNSSLSRLGSADVAPENAWLASPRGYEERFCVSPQAVADTHVLAEKLSFTGPNFGTVMPPFVSKRAVSQGAAWAAMANKDPAGPADELYAKALQGAKKRYAVPLSPKVLQRLEYELAIIREKKFCEYFLVVQSIVEKSPRICGRGSGAASLVAYCLGITNVCPLKYNLYFERFLHPGRLDPPDIDVDFAWDERDSILTMVLEKFSGHAAMVSSHIMFQPRMAVREVAKVFGLPDGEIGKVSKKLPWFWRQSELSSDLLATIQARPEFRFMDFPQPWPEIMAYAQALVGTPRYFSVHPGGVVITPDPIDCYVPIETAPKGVPLMQWEKDGAEEAGLVKIDLLGNRSLGVIRDTIASVTKEQGSFTDFDLQDPEDDVETQHNVAQGNTMGCFYIESPAMRLLQKKSRVGDFEHVVIHSSIIRPAANEFIQEYIKRLHTGMWEPIHPLLAGVLHETLGIMVYQEDVAKVAVKMAGFSHARADGLRKIMSKKEKEQKLKDYYEEFRQGARERGVAQKDIDLVWKMIISFSGYSFCKPHSASYARVSFQAAYLKTHYPAQFMAAVISNQGGFYSTAAYVSEARRMGVTILGPDINESDIAWRGQGQSLRVGFMAVKSLSASTMGRIILERKKRGFSAVTDFFTRVQPQEHEARALIQCGALDQLGDTTNRASLFWYHAAWHKQKQNPDNELFTQEKSALPRLPALPSDRPMERLRQEYRVLGFLTSCHPMVLFGERVNREKCIKADRLPRFVGKTVTFAGWLITGKVVKTKHNDPMEFLTFEDETGMVETTFFPKAYQRFCHLLDRDRPYLLVGKVESDWGAITLTVEHVTRMHG